MPLAQDIPDTNVPRMIFDIYLIENNSLLLGSEEGETAESRPTTLDELGVYSLVEPATQPPVTDGTGGATLPEDSLAWNADNSLDVAQFVVSQFELVNGLTNAGNIGVISAAGNSEGRVTDLFISSSCEGGGAASISGTPAQLSTLSASYAEFTDADDSVVTGSWSELFPSP